MAVAYFPRTSTAPRLSLCRVALERGVSRVCLSILLANPSARADTLEEETAVGSPRWGSAPCQWLLQA